MFVNWVKWKIVPRPNDLKNLLFAEFLETAAQKCTRAAAVGSYPGNGNDNRTIDISDTSASSDFQHDYVIVMSAGANEAVQRSSAMPADTSLDYDCNMAESNLIQTFNTNGFEVGDDARVNANGTTYHYVAWKAVSGKMNVGSYVGNAADDRDTTGVGFRPEYVIVKPNSFTQGIHRPGSVDAAADASLRFRAMGNVADAIQVLQSDGFQVGQLLNAQGDTHYWMAFARSSPTAVELVSFTAIRYGNRVLLQWRTGYELDNLGFHVHREQGGRTCPPDIAADRGIGVPGRPGRRTDGRAVVRMV